MTINPKTVADGQAKVDRLAHGGAVTPPHGPTFWSPGFGMLKDRVGTNRTIFIAPGVAAAA